MKRQMYMVREKDRHGKPRWYFRKGNGKRVVLPGKYGSPEFMAAYRAALAGVELPKSRFSKNTIGWLFARYQASHAFRALAPPTRRYRSNMLAKISDKVGHEPVDAITSAVIRQGRDDRAERPHAANHFLKVMSALFKWAIRELDEVTQDPTAGVDQIKVKSAGFRPWTAADIRQYRARWPLGTRERLAFELLFHTGLRRSDIVRLGPGHVDDGTIQISTAKTGEIAYIALSPELQAVLDVSPVGTDTYLVTGYGHPFSSSGFGNWFRKKCNAAGLHELAAHGLRKSAAEEVAEGGATDHELMSMFGWTNPSQAATYTRAASRKLMAKSAGNKRQNSKKS